MLTTALGTEIRLSIAVCKLKLGVTAFLAAKQVMAILLPIFLGRQNVLRADFPHSIPFFIHGKSNNH